MFHYSLLHCRTQGRLVALAYDNETLFPRCADSPRSIRVVELDIHSALGDAFPRSSPVASRKARDILSDYLNIGTAVEYRPIISAGLRCANDHLRQKRSET